MMLYLRTSVDDFRVTQLCSVLSGVLICMFLSNAFFQAGFVFSVAFFFTGHTLFIPGFFF